MAIPKKPVPKKPTPKTAFPKIYNPTDFLRGGKKIGDKYTAWNTYGGEKPDFGKGKGPGDPYHETQRTVASYVKEQAKGGLGGAQKPTGPTWPGGKPTKPDPRSEAIRRRLRGL